MNANETTLNNKLIAEFMGLNIINDGISYFDSSYKPLANYHSSLDSLKPVIDKIVNTIGVKTINECNDEEWFQCTNIVQMPIWLSIELIYHNVVEYIKWYNQNKL